jgi:hypothetical protein
MPGRPRVEVIQPRTPVRPGAKLRATVVLSSRKPILVNKVVVALRGRERCLHGHGRATRATDTALLDEQQEFYPKALFGEERIDVEFLLERNLPPSYEGRSLQVSYELFVHVDVPWWIDRRFHHPITVGPAVEWASTAPPRVHVTDEDGQGAHLGIEASIDRESVRPGETITGRCALTNLHAARVRGLLLELSAHEAPSSWAKMNVEQVRRYRLPLSEAALTDGHEVPFSITIPDGVPPSFSGMLGQLYWQLDVVADVRWGPNVALTIPIEVRAQSADGPVRRAAMVGLARRTRLWQSVGEKLGFAVDDEGELATLTQGECTLEIGRRERAAGNQLVAVVRWPSLGLGLSVGQHRLFDGRHFTIGHPELDRRYRITARDGAQIRPLFLPQLADCLVRFDKVEIDDTGAHLATAGSGLSEEPLRNFMSDALVTFGLLATQLEKIPPPASLVPHLAAWRAFGKRIEARFDPRAVQLREGRLHGARVDLGVLWSSDESPEVEGTLLKATLDPPLDRPIDPGAADLSPSSKQLISNLRAIDPHAVLGPRSLLLAVPWAAIDPAGLEPILSQMAALAGAIRDGQHAGPYR